MYTTGTNLKRSEYHLEEVFCDPLLDTLILGKKDFEVRIPLDSNTVLVVPSLPIDYDIMLTIKI